MDDRYEEDLVNWDGLIQDEIEAVEAYNKAIIACNDPHKIEVLKHIRDEELEHIKELEEIK